MNSSLKLGFLFVFFTATVLAACSTPSEGSGNILFEDDFSDESSGWDVYSDQEGFAEYYVGAYRIAVNTDSTFYWANPYQEFEDVVIEVTARKTQGGDDMQYGIICRHKDVNNWYALIITADGYAAIRKRYLGSELDFITNFVEAPSVKTGNAANKLRAECIGRRLALYVNGSLVVEATDKDLKSGDVGLMAGTFDQTFMETIFDDFVVRKP